MLKKIGEWTNHAAILQDYSQGSLSCNHAGHYWIDPNIGGKQDALQVYCSKPGCSCIDHSLQDSSVPTFHADAGDKPFSQLSKGYEVRMTLLTILVDEFQSVG